MSSGFLVRRLAEPFGTALQSRRPPESNATERPPRDRLPSACMTRCARGSSPEVLERGLDRHGPRWTGMDKCLKFRESCWIDIDLDASNCLSRATYVEIR